MTPEIQKTRDEYLALASEADRLFAISLKATREHQAALALAKAKRQELSEAMWAWADPTPQETL